MIRSTARGLARAPAYTLTLVTTLALGIAVASAAVAVGAGVLFRPLPHDGGDRIVHVRQSARVAGLENALFSVPEIRELRTGVSGFQEVAEFSSMRFTVLGMDRPRRVHAGVVTGNYFRVMGLGPVAGRVLETDDDDAATVPVAVLTRPFWSRVFGADPAVIGGSVRMNGRTVTVVGVVEDHPPYPEGTDLYVNMAASPHHLGASMNHDRVHRMTEAFARLSPGATPASARTEVEAVARRGREAHPEAYDPGAGWTVTVTTLRDRLTRRARPVLAMMGFAAGLVLLIALANVTNLALTRAVRLGQELSVRAALGASSLALRRRLLAENLVLGVAGAVVGVALARPAVALLAAWLGRFTIRAQGLTGGWLVPAAASAVAVAAAVIPALVVPVRYGSGITGPIRTGRETGRRGAARLQRGLVVVQVTISFALLVGAGLLLRTVLELGAVDPGVETRDVVVMDLPRVSDGRTAAEIREDYQAMVRAVSALPGVRSAGFTNQVPLREGTLFIPWTLDVRVEDVGEVEEEAPRRADFRTATPELLATLGIERVEGRGLVEGDDARSGRVALVNRAFVRRHLEGRSALGRRLAWTGDIPRFTGISTEWREIVGIVEDVRDHGLDQEPRPAVYVPFAQEPFGEVMAVRARSDTAAVVPAVTTAIRSVLAEQPVENVATMAALRSESMGDRALNARLVGVLAGLALSVAAVGIFGLLSYRVGTRSRELGVRMALGAGRLRVVGLVLGEALRLAALGVAAGGVVALSLAGLLDGLLYRVGPADPGTLLLAAGFVAGLTVAASAVPAWRAGQVEPARVLGVE